MSTCPLCLDTLAPQHTWMCVSARCSPPPGAPPGVTGPITASALSVGSVPAPPPPCGVCRGPVVEVCSTASCRFVLPAAWRETAATHVVMAGARATGKSVYIGVLVKQLQLYAELAGTRVTPATFRTEEAYRAGYERPLYEQRGMVEMTRPATARRERLEPLIFVIAPPSGSRHHLVISDVAGEDMDRPTLDSANLRAFEVADAVVMLYDPLSIPQVRSIVSGLVPSQRPGGDSATTLTNVITLVGTRRPKVAVAISKFDVLHAARAVPGIELGRVMQHTGAAFNREPDRRGRYDHADGALLHAEIHSLLQWLGAGQLTSAMNRLTQQQNVPHRFFAVSALGDAPDGSYLHDRGIAPFRCLDPLRWILDGRAL